MSFAYLCDTTGCSGVGRVSHPQRPMPSGWIYVEVEEATGHKISPKKRYHMCPSCASGYRQSAARALSPAPEDE